METVRAAADPRVKSPWRTQGMPRAHLRTNSLAAPKKKNSQKKLERGKPNR